MWQFNPNTITKVSCITFENCYPKEYLCPMLLANQSFCKIMQTWCASSYHFLTVRDCQSSPELAIDLASRDCYIICQHISWMFYLKIHVTCKVKYYFVLQGQLPTNPIHPIHFTTIFIYPLGMQFVLAADIHEWRADKWPATFDVF